MTKQYFLPTPERFHECLVCDEAVYNPLCQACLEKQIEAWLSSYPKIKAKLIPSLRKYLIAVHNEMDGAITCVACKKNRAAVCPYCFTEYVFLKLKLLRADNVILREFLQFFNYDFDRTGYTEEADKLGMLW